MAIKDYYSALGLNPSASHAEVKRSYRHLVKLVHPDSAGGGPRSGQFLELQEAYETLSDPVRRAEYDRLRAAAGTATAVAAEQAAGLWGLRGSPTVPLDDLDDQLERFGPLHADWGGARPPAPRPADGPERPVVELSLEDAFCGTETSIGGRRVRIPPGSRDGMLLRVPAAAAGPGARSRTAGGDGPRWGPGLIQIALRPDPRYAVVGDDLRTELAVPADVLRWGGRVSFETPGGRLTVFLPPGLRPGKVVRLRGRGLPATRLRRAGDILIRLALAGRPRGEGIG